MVMEPHLPHSLYVKPHAATVNKVPAGSQPARLSTLKHV